MQGKHGTGKWPAEKDITAVVDTLVSENEMSTFFDQINNILVTTRPKEAHVNTEE